MSMNWELTILLTGLMLFTYWFNYTMGGPLSDDPKNVNVGEILFFIPWWMAQRRIRQVGQTREFQRNLTQELAMTKDVRVMHGLVKDHKLNQYLAGREFFTWEKSLLCPICFHWWLTILVGAVLLLTNTFNARADLFLGAFIYLVNHFIIRKIS